MAISSQFTPQGRFSDWRLAAQSIIGFWSFYLVTVLLRGLFGPEAASAIGYRAVNAALGLVLTFLIYAVIRFLAHEEASAAWRLSPPARPFPPRSSCPP